MRQIQFVVAASVLLAAVWACGQPTPSGEIVFGEPIYISPAALEELVAVSAQPPDTCHMEVTVDGGEIKGMKCVGKCDPGETCKLEFKKVDDDVMWYCACS